MTTAGSLTEGHRRSPGMNADSPTPAVSFTERYESAGVTASLLEYLHACPICHTTALHHYCRVPSLFNPGEFIRYERCGGCGTVLRNPRLPTWYRTSRYEDAPVEPEALPLVPHEQAHYAYMLRVLRRRSGAGRLRLLDFGCGAGGLVLAARQAGFEVTGLELSRALADHVRATYHVPVFQGLVDDPRFVDERFELITTSQVFEHLVDPVGTLRSLRNHLAPPGLLLVEVPNLRDTRERIRRGALMDDSHLFYFSSRSLRRLLEDGGFRVLEVHEGLRPYRLVPPTLLQLPAWAVRLGERAMAALQLKTGLSVLAQLR